MTVGQQRSRVALILIPLATFFGAAGCWRETAPKPSATSPLPRTPDAALAELRGGNVRFKNSARSLSTDTRDDAEQRREMVIDQHPFAAILCCADSRVCPEFIFDQPAGRIFEIRNAGNVADDDVLASFEYAVEHLHVPLIVVLAHMGCGAIESVCKAGEEPLHDHLKELQIHMAGIHQQIMDNHEEPTPELLNRLSEENARQQALALIRDSRVLKAAVDAGDVRLVCGLYDMGSGAVEFFEPK